MGIDIIDWGFLKRAHRLSLKATGLMYGVLFLTVFVDLITAVAVGVFFANLLTVKSLTDLQAKQVKVMTAAGDPALTDEEQALLEQGQGRILLFHLSGPMSFGSAKTISQQMTIVKDYDVLILDLGDVPLLGVTAFLAVETMIREAYQQHRAVFLIATEGQVRDRLRRLQLLDLLTPQRLLTNRLEALKRAVGQVNVNHEI